MAAAARAPMPWSAVAGAVQAAGSAIGKVRSRHGRALLSYFFVSCNQCSASLVQFATSAESGIVVPTIAKCHASVLDSANTPLGMQLPAYTCDLVSAQTIAVALSLGFQLTPDLRASFTAARIRDTRSLAADVDFQQHIRFGAALARDAAVWLLPGHGDEHGRQLHRHGGCALAAACRLLGHSRSSWVSY